MKKTEMNLIEYIKWFMENIGNLENEFPYFAFFAISSGIEFLGKCMNDAQTWHTIGESRNDFENAIKKLNAFEKYRPYIRGGEKYNSSKIDLYDFLRCGLLHTTLPKEKILLTQGNNTIQENEDGALTISICSLVDDFKDACSELIDNEELWGKSQDSINFYVINDITTGVTFNTKNITTCMRK